MTDEMLALARENQLKAGVTNVEFLKGDIEAIPLPDNSVDVIVSNCVINLSTDKNRVFREAFRVLKPGGRFAVSDTVFQGDLDLIPEWIRRSAVAWSQCVSGSLEERDYLARLRAAGFVEPSVQVTQVYAGRLAGEAGQSACCGTGTILPAGIRLVSGFVRARKPGPAKPPVRGARPGDLPAVRRLLKEAGLPDDGLENQFGEAYAVAEADGKVVGVAGLETYGDHGLLRSLVVDSPWRGQGVGDALTRDRLAWAKARELKSVHLLTTTAAGYFPRLGFEMVDRRDVPVEVQGSVEFVHACPASAVAMRLGGAA
jgi:N-acetylglutamate synthase-like GNAT family acetyltransferase